MSEKGDRLNSRAHQMQRQKDALMRLTRSRALSEGKLEKALQEITEAATETLGCARSSIWLYDHDHSQIRCLDLYQRSAQSHENGTTLSAKDFPAYFKALDSERCIAAENAHTHPATCEFSEVYLTPLGIDAMLDAPIFMAGQMVGVVCNEHVGCTRAWSLEEEQFTGSIADMVALAMESDQRRKVQHKLEATVSQLERNLRQVKALIDVSMTLISVLDINVVLEKIIDLSREVMNAEASSLLLLDKPSGELRFHVTRGPAANKLRKAALKPGQGLAGWVAQSGQPLLISDAYKDPRFDRGYDQLTGFRTRSILTVPLKIKDEVLGVLQVLNKLGQDTFDQHDLSLFLSFACMGSIALENAQLFVRTKTMADELREALEKERRLSIEKEKMGAFIPRHVVDEISRNRERKLALGGKTVRATVLFSDIQGFTLLSESLDPQRVVSFLNEYMTAMATVIEEEGGILDKFIGDGVMAVFLPRRRGDNHAVRAVRAGVKMQQRLACLKEKWRVNRPEVAQLQMRCGINSGDMVAGNIGSETRMEYTVIGDNVNVASRIESNGIGGQVIISESTYEAVKTRFEANKMKPIQVKNRVQPVQIYSVAIPGPAPKRRKAAKTAKGREK